MSKWVELMCTCDESEAHVVKGILESENIEVITDSMKISPYPVNVGRIGEVRIFVRDRQVNRAKDILRIIRNGSGVSGDD